MAIPTDNGVHAVCQKGSQVLCTSTAEPTETESVRVPSASELPPRAARAAPAAMYSLPRQYMIQRPPWGHQQVYLTPSKREAGADDAQVHAFQVISGD